jgi:hypothetical protein
MDEKVDRLGLFDVMRDEILLGSPACLIETF